MSENETTNNPLQAVSNVIELKPDKKYLLVFKGYMTQYELHHMKEALKAHGVNGLIIALGDRDVDVIEIPEQDTSHAH